MTSPYAWYQYFVNTADADVVRYLRWFTFLSARSWPNWSRRPTERPHERAAQRRLAQELTTLVHGEAATAAVEHASQALFGRGELAELDEPTLAAALREAVGGRAEPRRTGRASPTCWWPAGCRRARARRGGRSPRAAPTSTTSASRATTGRRSRRTSCTASGWCCAEASGISRASTALDDLSELTHDCARRSDADAHDRRNRRDTPPIRPFDSDVFPHVTC